MAIGSRLTTPTFPVAAAVVSEPIVAAMYTPESQSRASATSGTVAERRPTTPKADIGTPCGFSQSESIDGHCDAGTVNRALGCAAFLPQPGVHSFPCQSMSLAGGVSVIPSHHTSACGVMATFVNIVLLLIIAMQLGLVFSDVPGATPKNPDSALIAEKRPSLPGLIHAISSPTVDTFQPLNAGGGISMAKFVLPHAEGNTALTQSFPTQAH